MGESTGSEVRSHCVGTTAVIYASDYLNKLTGEKIEHECRAARLRCRSLVIGFCDTKLVNSYHFYPPWHHHVRRKERAQVIARRKQSDRRFSKCSVNPHVVLAPTTGSPFHLMVSRPIQERRPEFVSYAQTTKSGSYIWRARGWDGDCPHGDFNEMVRTSWHLVLGTLAIGAGCGRLCGRKCGGLPRDWGWSISTYNFHPRQ